MDHWCIGHVDTDRAFSGGEVQVFLLLEGLRRRGHRVVLFCRTASRCAEEAARRGIEFVAVPMANDADWRGFHRLAQTFREFPLDLVHLHTGRANWLGGLAAWRSGIPAVSTRRMDRVVKPNWRTKIIYGRFVQRVVSISPAVTERLREGGVWLEKIDLIPEAVDPDRVRPEEERATVRQRLGAHPADCVLLAMAALVPRKGIDVLIDAFARTPTSSPEASPRLWIAGEGSQRKALERQARKLGLDGRVVFLGQVAAAADLYNAADVFVMPSRQEGLGVAGLEAMAMARPVVGSDVGGLSFSIVTEETGLLVPPGDVDALAAALARLVADPGLRCRLGSGGPPRIATVFSADTMVEAHLRLYQRILARGR